MTTHRLEFPSSGTGRAHWETGDLGAQADGFTISFLWRGTDRALQVFPAAGCILGGCNGDQEGLQIDAFAVGGGVARVVVFDGTTLEILYFLVPAAGDELVTLTMENEGANVWTGRLYLSDVEVDQFVSTEFANGLSSGEAESLFGARVGPADQLNGGSVAEAWFWDSALTAEEVADHFADGRPQDAAGPPAESHIMFGGGAGDTPTAYVDQTGNGNDCALAGTFSTGGSTDWWPTAKVGLRHTAAVNTETGWAEATAGTTMSVVSSELQIETNSINTRHGVTRTAHPAASLDVEVRAEIRVLAAEQSVIWVGFTPMRAGAGKAIFSANLVGAAGIMSFLAGDDVDGFGADVGRSDVDTGDIWTAVSGGSGALVDDSATNNDVYEIHVRYNHCRLYAKMRNKTQGGPWSAFVANLDHEIDAGHRKTGPSPWYLGAGPMLDTGGATEAVRIVSLKYYDNTVYGARWAIGTDSIFTCVDVDDLTEVVINTVNTLAEGEGEWRVCYGGPGARLLDLIDIEAATGNLTALGADSWGIQTWVNDSAAGIATVESRLTTLQGVLSPISERILHIANQPLTAEGITTGDMLAVQNDVAALLPGQAFVTDAVYVDLSNPDLGDQDPALQDDSVHMNRDGNIAAGTTLYGAGVFDYVTPPPATTTRRGGRLARDRNTLRMR